MSTPSLLILAGDGIGPEVMASGAPRDRLDGQATPRGVKFDVAEDLVGGAAYDKLTAHPLADDTLGPAQKRADAVLLGAGGVVRNGTTSLSAYARPEARPADACARKWICTPTCARPPCYAGAGRSVVSLKT